MQKVELFMQWSVGGSYFDNVDRHGKEQRLVRPLEKLGFEVSFFQGGHP
jgi:hypothetical protein